TIHHTIAAFRLGSPITNRRRSHLIVRLWRIAMGLTLPVAHAVVSFVSDDCRSTNIGLAMPTGNIENIDRLAQARNPPAQRADQPLPLGNADPEMAGPRRQIWVMQIIGLHPV